MLFWDVMDDSAALGETIPDDVRKGLPGRAKSDIRFGLDFLTELDKGLVQRIQELLNIDNQITAKIINMFGTYSLPQQTIVTILPSAVKIEIA